MKYLIWMGRGAAGIYWVGFAAMFLFIMYANFNDGQLFSVIFTEPFEFLYIFVLALFLAAIWPVAVYFAYMLTAHH